MTDSVQQAPADDNGVDHNGLANIIEALLLASDAPLSVDRLIAQFEDPQPPRDAVREALRALAARVEHTANELVEVSSGWRLQVRSTYAPYISRLWQEKPQKYSRALLETLSIICYRQPITRGEIEEIRGVSLSQSIIRTLLERGWVREVGHREVPGRPALLGTTRQFLDDFNLKSLEQLPSLPEVRDMAALDAAVDQLQGAPDGDAGQTETTEAETPADQPDQGRDDADSDDPGRPPVPNKDVLPT